MRNLFYLTLVLFVACGQVEQKTEIAQWRGDNRDGIYNESGLLKSWPTEGPELLWQTDTLGSGFGAPAVTNNTVYINGEIDSISHLFAFDLTGNLKWKSANGNEFMGDGFSASWPGPRSTPTVVENLVYTISGNGRLACFDATTGSEKWASHMTKDLHGFYNYFGYAESPLVDGDKVFCMPGGADTNIVALNRFTGEIAWTSKALSDTASYCSPMLIEFPTRKVLVNFGIHNLVGLDAATGELLWSHEQKVTQYNQPSNTPIFKDGHLYYVQVDGNGAVKLAVSEDGASINEVWRKETNASTFMGFLIKEDKIYNTCYKPSMEVRDINSGEIIDSLRIKTSTLITADNMLYAYSNNGSVQLINTADSLHIVSKFKVKQGTKEHFTNPVIKNGVLYIRHGNSLMAYNIKQTEA